MKKILICGAIVLGLVGAIAAQAATVYKPSALFDTQLSQAMDSVSTSTMFLQNGFDKSGNALVGPICFTIDGGTSKVEYVCGVVNGTIVSTLVRGIDFTNGVISSTTLQYAHRIGADVKVTDFPYLSQYARLLNGDDTLPNPLAYSNLSTSTVGGNTNNLASVGYVNSVAISGAPNGSTATKGIYQEATTAQIASGTNVGSTGADLIVPARYSSLTASTSLVNVMASGTIDPSFLPTGLNLTTTSTAPYLTPPGVIEAYTSSTAPNGWLLANGQAVATSSYPNLFALFGYTYGGSTSTFGLPNLGGRFIAGPSSTLSTTIGATGGATSTTTSTQIATTNLTNIQFGGGQTAINGITGATTTVAIIPPYIILQYIIKF